MPHYTKDDIINLPGLERMHLINSCGGVKSANLIGTISKQGITNLAVFNSVIHLGSNPPMLSFMLRPTTVERHSYNNFKEKSHFTVNHIHESFVDKAHQTSAKYDEDVSEFKAVGLTEDYIDGFEAPFVKESKIKMGCTYVNEYFIKEHGCRLIIGEIQHLLVEDGIQGKDGFLDLTQANSAGIIGLDGYVKTELIERFEYARPNKKLKPLNK
ncbi:flavin reductase family protein [Psychroflexus montanilacus]|uniref:flavin reductase family protein n=1 Tax=Psychroflexus montanilacus TaxID=2873598 RepID=UPI001CC9EF5F|nr:flavin reductase [Psychroflexus montanilacus]MBZ9651787.1 flavin reductase [Psychroflexus montanilacus]